MNIFVLLAHTMWYKYSRVALSLTAGIRTLLCFCCTAALQGGLAVPGAPGCRGRSKAVSRLHSPCAQDRWLGLDLCSAVHGTAAGAVLSSVCVL